MQNKKNSLFTKDIIDIETTKRSICNPILLTKALPLRIQDCSRKTAHMILSVKAHIENIAQKGKGCCTFIVACSGGADSLALLYILYYLRKQVKYYIKVVHINHLLRKEAVEESLRVKNIARLLGLPSSVHEVDVQDYAQKKGIGIEEAGRICRYTILETERIQYENAYICTGHHLNDVAEDSFMRLLRGSSVDMLFAMPLFDENRYLVRPLLYVSKNDILDFLNDIGSIWNEDMSNYDMDFLRCRIRSTIMPLFMQENPHFLASVKSLHKQTAIDIDFWEKSLQEYDACSLPRSVLQSLHKSARMRLYRKACIQLKIHSNSSTFFAIDDAFTNNKKNIFHVSSDYSVLVNRQGIRFIERK